MDTLVLKIIIAVAVVTVVVVVVTFSDCFNHRIILIASGGTWLQKLSQSFR